MKVVKGDLVLKKDYEIDDDLKVMGSIRCEGGKWNITAVNITARDIDAGNITAGDITARDIDAVNITARDIDAGNITAWDIHAGDITAGDITAWDITAGDISYYAFCVAYKNITCDGIEGRRENSFHKCLDGKITIQKKKEARK